MYQLNCVNLVLGLVLLQEKLQTTLTAESNWFDYHGLLLLQFIQALILAFTKFPNFDYLVILTDFIDHPLMWMLVLSWLPTHKPLLYLVTVDGLMLLQELVIMNKMSLNVSDLIIYSTLLFLISSDGTCCNNTFGFSDPASVILKWCVIGEKQNMIALFDARKNVMCSFCTFCPDIFSSSWVFDLTMYTQSNLFYQHCKVKIDNFLNEWWVLVSLWIFQTSTLNICDKTEF